MCIGKELYSKEENTAPYEQMARREKKKIMIKWCILILVKG